MHRLLSIGTLSSIAAVALLAGGCASTEDVQKAQATADQALSAAQAAQREADQNRADIQSLHQEVDQMQQHMSHGERG